MKGMFRFLLGLAMLTPVLAQSTSERIGSIDFYGYGNLDVAKLR